MSQENIEIGLRYAAAVRAGEVPQDLLTSDFVIENVETPVIQGTYVGAEGLSRWIADFIGVFEPGTVHYSAEPTDAGTDVVVAKINLTGEGRVSGAPLDLTHWGVLWTREGRVAKAIGYATRQEALHAAGLTGSNK